MAELLIIDDDPKICQFLSQLVKRMGHAASHANTLEDGLHLALKNHFDLILLDLEFPLGHGLEILPDLRKASSAPEVIIITGTGDIRGAELAFKYGAWDYVQKPFTANEVSLPITRALQYRHEKETAKVPVTLNRANIIGDSAAIQNCLDDIARASVTDASVLITGETGTGKELFSKAVHENSKRSTWDFVTVDCGSIPETLAESTLFGHEKGAFTGAGNRQKGVVLQAEKGTLFLDEIGDLPLNIQKSFLRVLQEKRIRPIGSQKEVFVDFRLVAATNRDLDRMVKELKFREDLLFRIRAIEIKLPPLRDREGDVEEIAISKIRQMGQRYAIGAKGVSAEFLEVLKVHKWPGNVRELINALEYALASAGEDPMLVPKHLPPEYRVALLNMNPGQMINRDMSHSGRTDTDGELPTLSEYREKAEKDYLMMLISRVDGNREKACRTCGISQSRLYGLLKKHNISRFRSSE